MKVFAPILLLTFVSIFPAFAQDKPKIINGAVVNSLATNLVKPEIPPAARAVNAYGAVSVRVEIDENGQVVSAEAVSGHALLKKSAEAAAWKSTFTPTIKGGKPVKVAGILVFNFHGGKETAKPKTIVEDFTEFGEVLNDTAVSLPAPEYPAAAKAVQAGGAVIVEVELDKEGNVISAKAVSGHPLLKKSAEKAAFFAKFKTELLKGFIVYKFVADGSEDLFAEHKDALSGSVLCGKATSLPKPAYPAAAKEAKADGAVNVAVVIGTDGKVIAAKAISGHELLREAAEQAASMAKFAPTLMNGKPVKTKGIIVYNFVAN
jgi:TonB family protein